MDDAQPYFRSGWVRVRPDMGKLSSSLAVLRENSRNKLGLSWAKLSQSWDWTLLLSSVDFVYLDFVCKNWLGGFSLKRFGVFGSVYLVFYISNIFPGRINFVYLVFKFWFSKFGSMNFVWYI